MSEGNMSNTYALLFLTCYGYLGQKCYVLRHSIIYGAIMNAYPYLSKSNALWICMYLTCNEASNEAICLIMSNCQT